MQTTYLGRTGIEVSTLCFGTMSFGREADEATSAAMFARCRDAGINFLDCANIYSQGRAEEILGGLISDCREELVITSKVCMPMGDGPANRGLSRRHIHQQIDNSLRRLGTDRLDVYFCHHSDPHTPLEETLEAMDDLVRAGKVLHVGASNWSAWRTVQAEGIAAKRGLQPVDVLQPMYNLAKRTCEIEILPMAKERNLGVIPYSPLGGGLLTGKYSPDTKDPDGRLSTHKGYAKRYGRADYYELAGQFSDHAAQAGLHPATLAVAWVKAHPAVTAPIIGARNVEQLEASLAAADVDLTQQQWNELSELSGRPPLPTDRDEERED